MAEQFPGVILVYINPKNGLRYRAVGDEGIKEILDKKVKINQISTDGECTYRESYRLSPLDIYGKPDICEGFEGKPEDPKFCAFCKHWEGLSRTDMFRLIVLFGHPEILASRIQAEKTLAAAIIDRFNDLDIMDYEY